MTYYKDLSGYSYFNEFNRLNTKNIGWLDHGMSFAMETPSDCLLSKLWKYCSISIAQSRGVHRCEFCNDTPVIFEERDGLNLLLGTSEIRVFGKNGTIYAAPNLIYHYVKVHKYKPPKEFLDSLSYSPPPDQPYFEKLREYGFEWRGTTRYEDTI